DLYVDANVGPMKDVHVMIENLGLGTLLQDMAGGSDDNSEAETATETADSTEGEGVTELLGTVSELLGKALAGIGLSSESLTISFASTLISAVLALVAPDMNIGDEFVELNPDKSYVKVDLNTFQIDFSAAVDPFRVGVSLTDFVIGFSDKYQVANEAVNANIAADKYLGLNDLQDLSQLAIETSIDVKVEILGTKANENGSLPINDLVSAFIADFALAAGVEIEDDIIIEAELYIAGNISLSNPDNMELMVEIVGVDNATTDGTIFGIYLRGRDVYVDMGILSENDILIADTDIAQMLVDALGSILGGESEAETSSDDSSASAGALEIVFGIVEDNIALTITEQTFKGLIAFAISYLASSEDGGMDLGNIDFDKLVDTLGLNLDLAIDFATTSVAVDFETSIFNVSMAIKEPKVAMEHLDSISARIDEGIYHYQNALNYVEVSVDRYSSINTAVDKIFVIEDEKYVPFTGALVDNGTKYYEYVGGENGEDRFNDFRNNKLIQFSAELQMNFNVDATYILVDAETASQYSADERFSLDQATGKYAQDPNGLYVKKAVDFGSIIEGIVSIGAVQERLAGIEEGTVKDLVNALVDRLSLEMYLNDSINESIIVRLKGNIDLEKLGITEILANLDLNNLSLESLDLDLETILSALEVAVELVINSGEANQATIAIFVADGNLYLDLGDLNGPMVKLNIIDLVDALSALTADNEAQSADDEVVAEEGSVDIVGYLNKLIKRIVIRSTGLGFGGVDVLVNSTLVADIVGLLTGTEVTLDAFNLKETESGIFIKLNDEDMGGKHSIAMNFTTVSGTSMALKMGAGLTLDVANEKEPVLTPQDKNNYKDISSYIDLLMSILDPENGSIDQSTKIVGMGMNVMINFDSNEALSINLGGLLEQYLGEMLIELQTKTAFHDGIAARISVQGNLGALDLGTLLAGGEDTKAMLEAFLANSDLDAIEFAVQILSTDENGTPIVDAEGNYVSVAGIYLNNGDLYIDTTGIYEMSTSYIKIPNFIELAMDLLANEEVGELLGGLLGGEAEASSEDEERDAVLSLIYSDTLSQIVLSKTLLSLVISTLMPSLGGFADTFERFDIALYSDGSDFGLNLNLNQMTVGFGVGGFEINIGDLSKSLTPDYVITGSQEVPVTQFYETAVSIESSVEFELSVSEGTIDIGSVFAGILGDLSGLTLEVPATAAGESSTHFRMDFSLIIDFANFANSEIVIEVFNIAETGANNLWIGAYYIEGKLFLDAPYFNIPKLSITAPIIAEFIEETIGGLLNEDIYTENEINGSKEAVSATSIEETGADALILLDKRQLSISISNKLIRGIVEMLVSGLDLDEYMADRILASAEIDAEFDDALILNTNVKLQLNDGTNNTDVDLRLSVKDVDVKFTTEHAYHLTAEDLSGYTELTEIENIVLSETIDISAAFTEDKTIDLSEIVNYLLGVTEQDSLKVALEMQGSEDITKVEAVISAEVKFSALLNYLSTLGIEGEIQGVDGDMDIVEMIEIIMNAVDNVDSIDIAKLLECINASVVINITAGGETRSLVGIYITDSIFVDLSGLDMPAVEIPAEMVGSLISGLLSGEAEGGESEAETAEGEEAEEGTGITLPLLDAELAGYITTFVVGVRMTSRFVQVVLTSNLINEVIALALKGQDLDFSFSEEDFTKQSYLQLNVDRAVYVYESALTATSTNSEKRFFVEESAQGNYVLVDGKYMSKFDLNGEELSAYAGKYYSVRAYDAYIKVVTSTGEYFESLENATKREKANAEKAGDSFVYYVKADDSFTAIAEADMLVANTLSGDKPLASMMIYLWDNEVGINVGFPELNVLGFNYELADESAEHKYYIVPEFVYTYVGGDEAQWIVKDNVVDTIDGIDVVDNYLNNLRYHYYRGEYYEINSTSLYVVNADGDHVPATSVYTTVDFANGQMIDFMASDREFFVQIDLAEVGITRYEEISASALYRQDKYRDRYVLADGTEAEGTVYYQRTVGGDYITKPEGLTMLNDSKMTVSASVEFELSVTEGKIDIGTIFANILGDLQGLELEVPAVDGSQGITSAHFRMDIAMLVDFSNPANSELSIELY
ncbi:MAG: hypothetical protein J6Q06_00490, partial [Clostridia bacterium]|nr:hypothetical protein [Clostridia bacterium]